MFVNYFIIFCFFLLSSFLFNLLIYNILVIKLKQVDSAVTRAPNVLYFKLFKWGMSFPFSIKQQAQMRK